MWFLPGACSMHALLSRHRYPSLVDLRLQVPRNGENDQLWALNRKSFAYNPLLTLIKDLELTDHAVGSPYPEMWKRTGGGTAKFPSADAIEEELRHFGSTF